ERNAEEPLPLGPFRLQAFGERERLLPRAQGNEERRIAVALDPVVGLLDRRDEGLPLGVCGEKGRDRINHRERAPSAAKVIHAADFSRPCKRQAYPPFLWGRRG